MVRLFAVFICMRRFRSHRLLLAAAAAAAGFSWTAVSAERSETKPDAFSNQATPGGAPPSGTEANRDQTLTPDQLYDVGKSLFDQYAPPEVKEQYQFPSKEQWDAFAAKLQRALDGDSVDDLAEYEPQARAAVVALRTLPGYEDYADWLEERLDLIQAARSTLRPPAPSPGQPPLAPPVSGGQRLRRPAMPYYDLWLQRLGRRPAPPGAADLMPMLRARFSAAGVQSESPQPVGREGSVPAHARDGEKSWPQHLVPRRTHGSGQKRRRRGPVAAESPRAIRRLAAGARRLQCRRRPRGTSAHGAEGENVWGDFPVIAGGDPFLCSKGLRHHRPAHGPAAGPVRRNGMNMIAPGGSSQLRSCSCS